MSSSETSYARKFELLLDLFPHPDRKDFEDPSKRRWKGVEIERESGEEVSSAYISALKRGDIGKPGMKPLHKISRVMGFPFQLWLTEPNEWHARLKRGGDYKSAPPTSENASQRAELLEQLFDSIHNRKTGEPYTSEEVAQESGGRLTREEVEGIRDGSLDDPTIAQILALCDVFGVDFSYWSPREGRPLLDHETLEALRDNKRYLILQKSDLSEEHADMVLLMMEQFGKLESKEGEG